MRITLRPRVLDRVCVCLLLLAGLQSLVFAVMFAIGPKPARLHCDRASAACTTFWPTALGGGDTYRHDLALLHDSRVVASAWKVGNGSGEIVLGQPARSADQQASYQRMAADFRRSSPIRSGWRSTPATRT